MRGRRQGEHLNRLMCACESLRKESGAMPVPKPLHLEVEPNRSRLYLDLTVLTRKRLVRGKGGA